MKKMLFMVVLLVSCGAIFAQNPVAEGQTQFNAGLGFSNRSVPVYIGLDYGIHKDITLGGELSFISYHERYQQNKYNHSVIGISGNANYHFNHILNIPLDWDFYIGPNLGFYIWNSPDDYPGSRTSGLGFGAQIGGRYYFTDKFGINLEFGGGNVFSGGKFGISLKL
ncbi:MAG: porin family protein [Candidatus Cloacimonetes bacterium]|nr:porin family protein [Candidatus Cloacimonadota bacterium]